MKIPESIAIILLIFGLFLLLNGISQVHQDTNTQTVNGTEIVVDNNNGYGLNMREFIGILCIVGSGIAIIVGGGLTTVRKAGVEPGGGH